MTKDELLINSASTVRNSPTLFAEFFRLYESEGYSTEGCRSCSFSNKYNAWRDAYLREQKKEIMSKKNSKNTFLIHRNYKKLYVPYVNEVITSDSSDELAIEFLKQDDGKYYENRAKNFFEQLPEALRETKKEVEVVVEEEESVTEVNKTEEAPKKKRKRRTKAEMEAARKKGE